MKKSKIIQGLLCAGLISALLFTGCSSPAGSDTGNAEAGAGNTGTNQDGGNESGTGDSETDKGGSESGNQNTPSNPGGGSDAGEEVKNSSLAEEFKFDFSDAKVLLGLNDGDNSIYKITSAGELVSAFSWDDIIDDTLSDKTISIKEIHKSPKTDDVIIYIGGSLRKTTYYPYKTEFVGPLIHVDKDNKVTSPSVLEESNPELYETLSIPPQESDSVKFDDNGIAYFIAYNGLFYDSDSSKYALFSYNPETKVRKQLLPYQTELMYEEFYVTNDGKCVILKEKSKTDKIYSISVVSVNNPSTKVTILPPGTDDIASITYDENTDAIYLNVRRQKTSYSDISVYYKSSRNGDIFNVAEEFLTSPEINIPQVFEREYIDCGEWPSRYKDSSDQFKPEKFLEYLFKEFSYFGTECPSIEPTAEDYYISFEKFKDIEEFKPIYEATKDKINEEAIAALDTGNIKEILMNAYLKNGRYAKVENCTETRDLTIKNSLLVDTLYDKATGKLVAEDEEKAAKIFNYCKCGEKHYNIFLSSETRYIEKSIGYYPKPLPEYLNSDGSINYTKILEAFFNSANVHGKKEFSLEYFKNCTKENFPDYFVYDKDLAKYKKILASDKKNEEALQFIYEDIERACLFEEYLKNTTTGGVENGKRYGKLFVIEGSDTPAFNVSFAGGQGFKYDYFPLISLDSGMWALNSNDYKIYPTTVHVMDSDGCILNHRGEEHLQINNYGNGYYLEKYFIDNNNCYMHISKGYSSIASEKDILYSVNFDEDTYEDLLINVPDADDMNIVSWIVTDGKLYFSGENNVTKEIINGYIDILTKAYTLIAEIKDSTVCFSSY